MCGLGVCGCVAFATQTLVEVWREAMAAGSARAGVRGAERLLAVDGQVVRAVSAIQTAIPKHELGEEVPLLVRRGAEPAREIGVRHVSDYPET